MKKKKVLKITPILVTLNVLVLFGIAGFYGYRLIKYYNLEHADDDGIVLLVDELIKRRSFLDETKGLVLNEEENIYRYKGEVEDNYLYYSGMTYRIIGIDKDKNIKAINEENVTLMYPGFEKGYKDSYVNKWLNKSSVKDSGVYEETFYRASDLIKNSYFCSDVIKDPENITCNEKNKDYKITLLSLYDYRQAGGKSSFLNNGKSFNLGTLNDEKLSYYVTDEGDIAVQQKQNWAIYVRPVITISSTAVLISGNCKKDNPFIIESHNIDLLSDAYVGNYVTLNKEAYRIVRKYDDKVLVVKANTLKEADKETMVRFGGEDNIYSPEKGIGYFLNVTYHKTLELKDSTVKGDFYTGQITLDDYDYSTLKSSSVQASVGMLTMGDMFINESNNELILFRGIEADNIVYVVKDGHFFGDVLTSNYAVRPAVYLKADLDIDDGKGTLLNPYVFASEEVPTTTTTKKVEKVEN